MEEASAGPGLRARLLLLESSSVIRRTVTTAFREKGFEVRAEVDGSHLDWIVESFRPDIVILDARLPHGPDGFAMVRQLRERTDRPIVLLTAGDSLHDRLTGFQAGADDSMSKPFWMAELVARVEALLWRSARGPRRTGQQMAQGKPMR